MLPSCHGVLSGCLGIKSTDQAYWIHPSYRTYQLKERIMRVITDIRQHWVHGQSAIVDLRHRMVLPHSLTHSLRQIHPPDSLLD